MNSKVMLSLATVALFTATASAYEGVETNAWFTATQTTGDGGWSWASSTATADWNEAGTAVSVDTTVDNPYVFTPTALASTPDGYRVTADVTFVRSASEYSGEVSGSPLAALAVSSTSWYGVNNGNWVALSGVAVPTTDTATYAVTLDFKTNGVTRLVRYTVNGTVLKDANHDTEFTCARATSPASVKIAGYGTVADLIGQQTSYIVIAVADVSNYNPEEPGDASDAVKATYAALTKAGWTSVTSVETFLAGSGENGKPNWVNYTLGLDSTKATALPFAAPVQTSDDDKISFSLGGVDFDSITASGATVTYTVESTDSLVSPSWDTEVTADADADAAVDVPTTGVKYYRIKVTIKK